MNKPMVLIQCPYCHKSFDERYLDMHVDDIHSKEPYIYHCDHVGCRFKTNNYEDFGGHHLGHLGIRELTKEVPSFTYNCGHPGCDFGCESNNDFSKHLDTHLTLKAEEMRERIAMDAARDHLYMCEFCKFGCDNHSFFLKHLERHKPMIYPYNCVRPDCGFGCNDQQDFLKHQKKHDLPFGKPISVEQDSYQYTCASPGCGFKTDDARHFDDHKMDHTHKQYIHPFNCDYGDCKFGCEDYQDFLKHLNTHKQPWKHGEPFRVRMKDWPSDSILLDAYQVVRKRRNNYGGPQENFKAIATMWSVILKREVTLTEVGLCMIALKTCRHMHKPDKDNLVDIAGYADCVDVVERETDEKMV